MPIVVSNPTIQTFQPRPQSTNPRPSDIGPIFDLMLATRDGSVLPCKNKDGNVVNVSRLAFMTSIDRNQVQHEETELQHKDQLVQLASPNLIDREFDQWPQVTQGDWSGGALQRVFSGATPVTTFGPASDPKRYWGGENGLVWPLTDYLPMRPYLSAALQPGTGTLAKWVNPTLPATGNPGCVGGILGSQSAGVLPLEGFFVPEAIVSAPFEMSFWSNGSSWNFTAGAGSRLVLDLTTDPRGGVWWINSPDGTALNVYSGSAGAANTISITLQDTIIASLSATTVTSARMTSGLIGNAGFIAVAVTALPSGGVNWTNEIKVYNVGGVGPATTVLNLATLGPSVVTGPTNIVSSMAFLGDQLIICLVDTGAFGAQTLVAGTTSTVVSYNIPSATFTTLAQLPGTPGAVIGVVAGSVLIISQTLDLFLLQGASLQYITTLPPPVGASSSTVFPWVVSRPATFGPYAIFAVAYQTANTTNMDVYAYDATFGRLFKVKTLSYTGLNQLPQPGFQLATFSFWQRSATPAFNAYFNIAVPVDDISGQAAAVQILHFGVLPPGVAKPLPFQQGTDIISSLIDFTSASPKLYRQVVADFTPIANDPLATVRIQAWLDQDPANLNSIPDFDTGIANGFNNTGIKTLALPINRMAKKLVYEATTDGGSPNGSNTWIPAPKLQSVSVQAATGWTRTMILNLGDNVNINSNKNVYCWEKQSVPGQPAIDGTVAYNFLRQLWRLKGGQVQATFPNQDLPANWLLQDIHWDSPKPYGVSFRPDEKSSLGYICTIKLREDI